jgi:hypothetical protein
VEGQARGGFEESAEVRLAQVHLARHLRGAEPLAGELLADELPGGDDGGRLAVVGVEERLVGVLRDVAGAEPQQGHRPPPAPRRQHGHAQQRAPGPGEIMLPAQVGQAPGQPFPFGGVGSAKACRRPAMATCSSPTRRSQSVIIVAGGL